MDFFISYNKADLEWAEWIAFQLEENGFTVIIQAWDSRPGTNFIAWMNQSSIDCERVLAILSPEYFQGKYSQMEWTSAIYDEKILPIRVRDFTVPGLFGPIGYIDLVGLGRQDALKTLLMGINRERSKPTSVNFPNSKSADGLKFPGSLPALWNIPTARNHTFAGQNDILSTLNQNLLNDQQGLSLQVLTGFGGVGKTQIAIEFAYRYSIHFDLIWWIRSEYQYAIISDFTELGTGLKLPVEKLDEKELSVGLVNRFLGQQKDWLLIFDNANSEREILRYLPQGGQGSIIITSQNAGWRYPMVRVKELNRPDSISFFMNRTGSINEKEIDAVCDKLGDLPLALDQAAAYINETGISFNDYLSLFTNRQERLLEYQPIPIGYSKAVNTTWLVAIEKIQERSSIAFEVLKFCSFLASEEIPRQMILRLGSYYNWENDNTLDDELELNEVIRVLRYFSLVQFVNSKISIHRLITSIVRNQLVRHEKEFWVTVVSEVLLSFWPSDENISEWNGIEKLLPHTSAFLKTATEIGSSQVLLGILANRIGYYSSEKGMYEEAEKQLNRAINILFKDGNNHLELALAHKNLAILYRYQGKYQEALPMFEIALDMYKSNFGEKDLLTAKILYDFGILYLEQHLIDDAEKYISKSIDIWEGVLGSHDIQTVQGYEAMAVIFLHRKGFQKSLKLHQKTLTIRTNKLGDSHLETTYSHMNIGFWHVHQKQFSKAEDYYLKALEILKNELGDEHPRTLMCIEHIGVLYRNKGELLKSESFLRKSYSTRQLVLGSKHMNTAGSCHNLAKVLMLRGLYDESKLLYEKAIDVFLELFDEENYFTKTAREGYEELLKLMKD